MGGIEDRVARVESDISALRNDVRDVGSAVAEMSPVVGQVAALSVSLNHMRDELSKWVASGSLLCAVMLFIAVRALGF